MYNVEFRYVITKSKESLCRLATGTIPAYVEKDILKEELENYRYLTAFDLLMDELEESLLDDQWQLLDTFVETAKIDCTKQKSLSICFDKKETGFAMYFAINGEKSQEWLCDDALCMKDFFECLPLPTAIFQNSQLVCDFLSDSPKCISFDKDGSFFISALFEALSLLSVKATRLFFDRVLEDTQIDGNDILYETLREEGLSVRKVDGYCVFDNLDEEKNGYTQHSWCETCGYYVDITAFQLNFYMENAYPTIILSEAKPSNMWYNKPRHSSRSQYHPLVYKKDVEDNRKIFLEHKEEDRKNIPALPREEQVGLRKILIGDFHLCEEERGFSVKQDGKVVTKSKTVKGALRKIRVLNALKYTPLGKR